MKRLTLTLAVIAILYPLTVHASCTTRTYVVDGRIIQCMTCCYVGGSCTTSCF